MYQTSSSICKVFLLYFIWARSQNSNNHAALVVNKYDKIWPTVHEIDQYLMSPHRNKALVEDGGFTQNEYR